MTERWRGEIDIYLENGGRWSAAWVFTSRRGCSKPSKLLAAAKRAMLREKVRGRSKVRRYVLEIEPNYTGE